MTFRPETQTSSQPFPLHATLADGKLRLVECLAGLPEQGVYRAASVSQSPVGEARPPYYLVSTALEPDDFAAFQQLATMELLIPIPGVAPLFGIDLFDAERSEGAGFLANTPTRGRTMPQPPLIALVEACPAGVRSHDYPLPMPIPTAARLALQVAFSLEMAHAHGIGIGGIRPEHIFISGANDAPAVSGLAPRAERFWQMLPRPDFGIAPAYLDIYDAPEHLNLHSNGRPTPAGDIFSLCATLAFWLCGRHPFGGPTPDAQISAMREGDHIAWPLGTGDILRHPLIRRGLDPDPIVRPSIAEALNVLRRFAPDVRPAWGRRVA